MMLMLPKIWAVGQFEKSGTSLITSPESQITLPGLMDDGLSGELAWN
jgi:hypothetical protein